MSVYEPRGAFERRTRYSVVPPYKPSSQAANHPISRSLIPFVRRIESAAAAAGGTPSGPRRMTRKQSEAYGPQFPAASRAWTHAHVAPGAAARPPCHETFSTVPSNAPSTAVIGRPVPLAAGVGGATSTKSSAAATVLAPRFRSSAVARNATVDPAPGGLGATRTLPAQRIGPSVSPPGRAISKVASVR